MSEGSCTWRHTGFHAQVVRALHAQEWSGGRKRRGGKNKNKHQKASDMGMHFSALGEEPMSRSGQKVQVSTGVHLDLLARAGVALRTGRR